VIYNRISAVDNYATWCELDAEQQHQMLDYCNMQTMKMLYTI